MWDSRAVSWKGVLFAALSIALGGAPEAAAQSCTAAAGTIVDRLYVVLSQTEDLEAAPIATYAGQRPVAMVHDPALRRWRVDVNAPVQLGTLSLDRNTGRQLNVAKVGWMFGQLSEPAVAAEMIAGTSRCTAVIG